MILFLITWPRFYWTQNHTQLHNSLFRIVNLEILDPQLATDGILSHTNTTSINAIEISSVVLNKSLFIGYLCHWSAKICIWIECKYNSKPKYYWFQFQMVIQIGGFSFFNSTDGVLIFIDWIDVNGCVWLGKKDSVSDKATHWNEWKRFCTQR